MANDGIESELLRILRQVFGRPDLLVSRETTANDVDGWDSFRMVEILMAVEEHFGVRLRSREIDRLKKVGDFADLLIERLAKPD